MENRGNPKMKTLQRLLAYVKPYIKTLVLIAGLLIVGTGLGLIPPLIQRSIIDDVIGNNRIDLLLYLIGLLIGAYALQTTCGLC